MISLNSAVHGLCVCVCITLSFLVVDDIMGLFTFCLLTRGLLAELMSVGLSLFCCFEDVSSSSKTKGVISDYTCDLMVL